MFPQLSLPAGAGSRLAHLLNAGPETAMQTNVVASRPNDTAQATTHGAVALGLAHDVAKGVTQGLIGLVSDVGKGWVMIGDTLIHGGAHVDRIAAFDLRPWSYGPGPGQVAGMAGEMLSPAAAVKSVQAGVAGARMLGPILADEAAYFLARQGLLLSVVERGGRVAGVRLFENQLPHRLAHELAEARALGVKPMRVDDPAFAAMANEGKVKFVVTESGELLIGPHTRHGVEISHAVLSRGSPVQAAGEAEVFIHGHTKIVTNLREHSGHFMNGASAAQNEAAKRVANAAFGQSGLQVVE